MIPDGASLDQIPAYTATVEGSEFLVGDLRDATNRILGAMNLNSIPCSQENVWIGKQSNSGMRHLAS